MTFQSAVESFHYVTDEANVVVRGSDHTLEQSRYNTDLVYIQNRDACKRCRMTMQLGLPVRTVGHLSQISEQSSVSIAEPEL